MSDDLVDYALDCATPDVAATLRWLEAQGFVRSGGIGGPRESFGDVLLDYERDEMRVRVVRDRGQWFIEMTQVAGEAFHPLNVLLTAMSGDDPDPGTRDDMRKQLPDQLPFGVSWGQHVPAVVAWLSGGDRSRSITEADARWRAAMETYWKQ